MFGLDYVIFRPHNVYGEYQNLGDKYRNVVGIFMNQLMQGKPLTIFGDGEQKRAFSYVGDIAPHVANCVNVPAAYGEVIKGIKHKDKARTVAAVKTLAKMATIGAVTIGAIKLKKKDDKSNEKK